MFPRFRDGVDGHLRTVSDFGAQQSVHFGNHRSLHEIRRGLPDTKPKTKTIDFCLEQFVNTFGYPDIILTDQVHNFESFLIKEMCVRLNIDKQITSAYRPQCNRQTEKFNLTMNAMLAQYVDKTQTYWDLWLPSVVFAYRTAVYSSTGHSPYEMVFELSPKQPIEFKIPAGLAGSEAKPLPNTSLYFAKRWKQYTMKLARNLRAAQSAQKAYYD